MWLTPIVHIAMWPTTKGFTRVNNLVHIAMWLTPKEWSCFACERNLVNEAATFRVVCILQIFYVYNALHGATLANCSHFQYVSRSRLRVIQIGVKACIDVTLYDELFVTSITEKHLLIPLRIFWPLSSDPLLEHYCTLLPNLWWGTQSVWHTA